VIVALSLQQQGYFPHLDVTGSAVACTQPPDTSSPCRLLSLLSSLPCLAPGACSCAGVAIYGFMCLFGSVAVPLYVMFVWEQAAQHRWQRQVNRTATEAATTATTSADDAGSSSPAAEPATGSSRSTAQHSKPSRGVATGTRTAAQHCSPTREVQPQTEQPRQLTRSSTSRDTVKSRSPSNSRPQSGGSSTNSNSRGITRLDVILLKAEELAAAEGAAVPRLSLSDVLSSSNAVVRWCVHVLVLVVLLVGCWLVSNAVALVLLPRVLSSQQLGRWCPNRPYAPYVIAGQVYDGL